MSEHKATIEWKRESPDFAYETYNRDHDWSFDAGITVRASAAPAYKGNERCVDPEEAFVASLVELPHADLPGHRLQASATWWTTTGTRRSASWARMRRGGSPSPE